MQHWHEKTAFSGSFCPEPWQSALETHHLLLKQNTRCLWPASHLVHRERRSSTRPVVQLITTYPKGPSGPPGTLLHNGFPADDLVVGDANTIAFYRRQPAPLTCSNGCERLGRINQLTSQRTEIGFLLGMGEFLPDQAGEGLLSCSGGSYTTCSPAIRSRNHTLELSCISNDSRRCAAFTFQDEWNVSMKFLADIDNNRPTISRRFHSMPILRATPCDTTRVVRTFSPKEPISTL